MAQFLAIHEVQVIRITIVSLDCGESIDECFFWGGGSNRVKGASSGRYVAHLKSACSARLKGLFKKKTHTKEIEFTARLQQAFLPLDLFTFIRYFIFLE